MKKIKLFKLVIYSIIILLSIINYESDAIKFIFSGHSATYEIDMIRHHFFLTLFLAILLVGLSIYNDFKKKRWQIYWIIFISATWIFTMQTYAVNRSQNVLISGWSFVKLKKCDLTKNNLDSIIVLDPYLQKKIMQNYQNNCDTIFE